ncbi:MAG: CBS domain-containing protein [Candidatus Thermoplasmatota archaeon]|nr:CBS domain-containing protein [Candidatus Thermoplasmatota archaeon]
MSPMTQVHAYTEQTFSTRFVRAAITVAREKERVRDFMTRKVTSLEPELTVDEAIERIVNEGHVGLPVADDGRLLGFLTPKELLRNLDDRTRKIRDIIAPGTVVAHPEMSLDDAARILFRMGVKELPVVDDEGKMVGVVSTTDIIRSHIERVTPTKMQKLCATLENLYGVEVEAVRKTVTVDNLLPTQKRIFGDELEGRRLELLRGLAEPILVIEKEPQDILVDGHHRVIAAKRMGHKRLDAYVLKLDRNIELGLERNARAAGLETLDDVEISDEGQHPLVEVTTRFLTDDKPQTRPVPGAEREDEAA